MFRSFPQQDLHDILPLPSQYGHLPLPLQIVQSPSPLHVTHVFFPEELPEELPDGELPEEFPEGEMPNITTTISIEDIDEIAEMYDEYDFKVFVGCFLRCMKSAGKDGLYVDGVVADNKN